MRYRVAIFDLDGTLLDTLDDLASATDHALAAFSLPPRSKGEVRQFVGNGIANLIRLAVPAGSPPELTAAVHKEFDAYYTAHHLDRTAPYAGIPELLADLRAAGVRLCVVSNKGDYAVQPLVAHFFGDAFDFACGERESEGIRRKPWPDTVLASMEHVGADAAGCVYVGDSEVDLKTAANAGIDCLIVSWGFRDEDFLRSQGARVIVHDTEALKGEILGTQGTPVH